MIVRGSQNSALVVCGSVFAVLFVGAAFHSPFLFFGSTSFNSYLPRWNVRPFPTEPLALSACASPSSKVSRQDVAAWESWGRMALGGRHDKPSSAETPSPRSHEQICVLTDEEPLLMAKRGQFPPLESSRQAAVSKDRSSPTHVSTTWSLLPRPRNLNPHTAIQDQGTETVHPSEPAKRPKQQQRVLQPLSTLA
jgi:hypothetical protein